VHVLLDLPHIFHPCTKNAFALLRAVFTLCVLLYAVHLGGEDHAALLDVMELPILHTHLLLQISSNLRIDSKQIFVIFDLEVARILHSSKSLRVILEKAFSIIVTGPSVQLILGFRARFGPGGILRLVIIEVIRQPHRHLYSVFVYTDGV